jgi:hypothetical protein
METVFPLITTEVEGITITQAFILGALSLMALLCIHTILWEDIMMILLMMLMNLHLYAGAVYCT